MDGALLVALACEVTCYLLSNGSLEASAMLEACGRWMAAQNNRKGGLQPEIFYSE